MNVVPGDVYLADMFEGGTRPVINDLQIAAELDASNNVVARFVYGTRNVPEYMVTGAVADCNTVANQANC
jgi:hypothetical protein